MGFDQYHEHANELPQEVRNEPPTPMIVE